MMALRAFMKTAAAEAACRTGASRLVTALAAAGEPVVLGYHRVVDDCAGHRDSIPPMLVSTRTLEHQLDWVGRHFRFVSLDELGERLERGARGERLAAVTFDDGYRDVYEHAFPLLKRKGIPAAVFVVSELLGTARLLIHDRLYLLLDRTLAQPAAARAEVGRLLRRLGLRVPIAEGRDGRPPHDAFATVRAALEAVPHAGLEQLLRALEQALGPLDRERADLQLLDWDMVRDMHRAGFTIGSHTCQHVVLTHEGPDRVRQEVTASRRRLEAGLGAPVRHFAYPDGRFDPAVVGEVAAAGYRFAYTTCRHRDGRWPLLTLPRRLLWENSCRDAAGRFSPAIMRCQVEGVFDLLSGCRQDHGCPGVDRAQPQPA